MTGMTGGRVLVQVSADQIRGDRSVAQLVTHARKGERQAWDELVERYCPLVWSICFRHRLHGADANEVGRSVFLQLAEELDSIGDPAELPGWLATATRRECRRALQEQARAARPERDVENIPGPQDEAAEDELLMAERNAALREAFADLPSGCRQLIGLLIADPPVSHAEISAKLGVPAGDIPPARARCLARLRSHPAIVALTGDGVGGAELFLRSV
jgi:RNA polymerase sigma factor (sigma-70 family)